MKTKIWTLSFLLIFFSGVINAQSTGAQKESSAESKTNPLKGLVKKSLNSFKPDQPVELDPSKTPMYYENLSPISDVEFMKVISSGKYMFDPYVDSNENVKAFVFREVSEQEKKSKMVVTSSNSKSKSVLIGKKATPFTVTDIRGNEYSLKKLKGKVVVINFWFVECKPCVAEMPELNKLVDKYKGKDVVFLGIATNEKSKIEEFLKTKTYKYNIIAEGKKVITDYEVSGFPTHIIINKKSKISHVERGLGENTIEALDEKIESLL